MKFILDKTEEAKGQKRKEQISSSLSIPISWHLSLSLSFFPRIQFSFPHKRRLYNHHLWFSNQSRSGKVSQSLCLLPPLSVSIRFAAWTSPTSHLLFVLFGKCWRGMDRGYGDLVPFCVIAWVLNSDFFSSI